MSTTAVTDEAPATEAPYQPQPSDLVRCVVEGYVAPVTVVPGGAFLTVRRGSDDSGAYIAKRLNPTWTLLEPAPPAPVVTFGPGDILRRKATDCIYELRRNGYIARDNYYRYRGNHPLSWFTSDDFDLDGGTA